MRPPLAGTEDHPQARMVLSAALEAGPSHAYLFHGPAGTGKRTVARAFAAELLAEGADDREAVRLRVQHGTHPDLTWVRPSGAHVMRVEDVDAPVVGAATRTPFEARRRVFVLERVDTMNDEVANRLLKTLEEPAAFVHLILLTDALGRVIETVVSRCQPVRFDPLPAGRIAETLAGRWRGERARRRLRAAGTRQRGAGATACLARGAQLRSEVEAFATAALAGEPGETWKPILERAEAQRDAAEEAVAAEAAKRLELEPKGRDRRALERDFEDAAKRDGRRARTEVLDLALTLTGLAFRDLVCLAEDAPEAVLGTDRADSLAERARGRDARRLRDAAERCEDVRQALELNVSEDLALSALGLRLAALTGAP